MDYLDTQYLLDSGTGVDVAAGGLLLLVVLVVAIMLYHRFRVPGEEPVKKEEYDKIVRGRRLRRRLVNRRVGDKTGDMLLDMYANGELDDDEYISYFRRFSRHFKDFVPRKLTQSQLKVAIQRRLNTDIYKPVKLPPDAVKAPSVLDKILSAHYASK